MTIRIVAVGQRIAAWADTAANDYLGRIPPDWKVELRTVRAVQRAANERDPTASMEREAERISALIPARTHLVVLDERGTDIDSQGLSMRLAQWRSHATVALVIGGADGIAPSLKARADETLRLSRLTLPHALARVLLAEQLYRAWSLLAGHPYHRD